jgi:hypothetical protein
MDASDAWRYALAVFLVLTGLGLTFMLLRLAGTFARVNRMLEDMSPELLRMLGKSSTTIDHVNGELVKVGKITDSAVDAAEKADQTVRAVSTAVTKPVKSVAGASAGVGHAVASFRSRRSQRGGVV